VISRDDGVRRIGKTAPNICVAFTRRLASLHCVALLCVALRKLCVMMKNGLYNQPAARDCEV